MAQIPKSMRINYQVAADMYASGLSLPIIARILQSSAPTILRAMRHCGVESRPRSEACSMASRGNRTKANGYINVMVGRYNRMSEHKIIAERILGRKLKRDEMVHHIDFDGSNNSHANLLICDRAYHTWLHNRMRRDPYWSQFKRKGVFDK